MMSAECDALRVQVQKRHSEHPHLVTQSHRGPRRLALPKTYLTGSLSAFRRWWTLQKDGAKAIAEAAVFNQALTKLDMSNNCIQGLGAVYVASSLRIDR
jgi:hypothetical protein